MTAQDRRRVLRARASWPVSIRSFNGSVASGELVDFSLSGLKVRAESEVLVGAAVTVRLTLPAAGGDLDLVGQVLRRDPDGVALALIDLPEADAERLRPLLVPFEARRRSPRVAVNVPLHIARGAQRPVRGQTLDLSAFGARITTEAPLAPGDRVTIGLDAPSGAPMRVPAVVWDVDLHGAVLVFVRVAPGEFTRLRDYVQGLAADEP